MSQVVQGCLGLVEHAHIAKVPGCPSEDGLVVTSGFVAVFDGMSDPVHGDDVAAATAALVDGVLGLAPDATAREAVDALSACRQGHPGGAVGVIFSRARREVWRVGDVHWAFAGTMHPGSKQVDEAMTHFRAAVNWATMAGMGAGGLAYVRDHDPGLAATFPLLRAQGTLANRPGPFGYGVFDGGPVPDELVEVTAIHGSGDLVFASDGYLSPAGTLAEAEADLARAIARDPACIAELSGMGKALQPGANGPDDRTYVRIRIEE